jgi:uncharacterized protein YdeI (YjbR/CyaY-like superfamily)|tara:strand:- start:33 stop:266 length:234 start_codon:yes stop_codon:yes gene_type:complete
MTPPRDKPVDAIDKAIALFLWNQRVTNVVAGISEDAEKPTPKSIKARYSCQISCTNAKELSAKQEITAPALMQILGS